MLTEVVGTVLNGIVSRGDVVQFEEFKRLAEMRGYHSLLGNHSTSTTNAYSSAGSHQYNMAPNRTAGAGIYQNRLPADSRGMIANDVVSTTLIEEVVFKSSPFYEILQTLLPLQDLPGKSSSTCVRSKSTLTILTQKPHQKCRKTATP